MFPEDKKCCFQALSGGLSLGPPFRPRRAEPLDTIVRVAEVGGGKMIVVDADGDGLLGFSMRNGFKPIRVEGNLSFGRALGVLGHQDHVCGGR